MRIAAAILSAALAMAQGYIPSQPDAAAVNQTITNQVIDATGEMVSFCGLVYIQDGTARSIRKVGFFFGSAITKAGGSALTLSLQNVSSTTGPPMQPDGTQDETVAIANGSITASTWLLSGALSADRSVSLGTPLCVVIEFDGAGRLGTDSITIATMPRSNNPATFAEAGLKTGGTWATTSRNPIMVFEFSDGTYGTLDGALHFTAHNTTVAFNSSSGSDEYALKFTVPTAGVIDGAAISVDPATGGDFDVVLYQGTTALATTSIDENWWSVTTGPGFVTLPRTTVAAGTTYYLAIKPTTTTNVTLYGYTGNTNNFMSAYAGGTNVVRSSRVDAGAWSDSSTIIPAIRVRFTPTSSGGTTGGAFIIAQ